MRDELNMECGEELGWFDPSMAQMAIVPVQCELEANTIPQQGWDIIHTSQHGAGSHRVQAAGWE